MSFELWAALAFMTGAVGAVAYYRDFRWVAPVAVVALPIILHLLSGWAQDGDFRHTGAIAAFIWIPCAFVGTLVGVTAVVLGIAD